MKGRHPKDINILQKFELKNNFINIIITEQILGQIVKILIIGTILTIIYYFIQNARRTIIITTLVIATILLLPIQITIIVKIRYERIN